MKIWSRQAKQWTGCKDKAQRQGSENGVKILCLYLAGKVRVHFSRIIPSGKGLFAMGKRHLKGVVAWILKQSILKPQKKAKFFF